MSNASSINYMIQQEKKKYYIEIDTYVEGVYLYLFLYFVPFQMCCSGHNF